MLKEPLSLSSGFVSRSEARRLLAGLDRFKAVELDFSGVSSIGQGFADEVFRVFAAAQPEIDVVAESANDVVDAMIQHVRSRVI